MEKLLEKLSKIVQDIFEQHGYSREYGTVNISNRQDLCQFQCNGALTAAKKYNKPPIFIAKEIAEGLKNYEGFENVSAANPGFINISIKDRYLVDYLKDMYTDKKYGCVEAAEPLTIIVDYGGANIAKPLHVGHLRSAIIGESLKRIARFLGHNVIGDVHLGDWGLQIGLVISELKRRNPELPYFDKAIVDVTQTKHLLQLMS